MPLALRYMTLHTIESAGDQYQFEHQDSWVTSTVKTSKILNPRD